MRNKLLFTCYHCYLDPSNGASITAREILSALLKLDWEIQTLTGPGLDSQQNEYVPQLLADHGISGVRTLASNGDHPFDIVSFNDNGILSTLFVPQDAKRIPSDGAGTIFLQLLKRTIANFEPDVMLTYGGFWLGPLMLKLAHREKVKTSVLIQNLAYHHQNYFCNVDRVIVPSKFSAKRYEKTLGISSVPIAPVMNELAYSWSPDRSARKYLTFVNPEPGKGLYWLLQMATVLDQQRPDIPLLVVEARGNVHHLARTGAMIDCLKNLYLMQNTPDPGDFYRVSKVVVMPSYFEETFGRVAAEAMMAGIPVIGSNRGALPEVIGDAGILLEIPNHFTPQTNTVPSPQEVWPWVEAVIRLWDDNDHYENTSRKCRERAQRWHPNEIIKSYDACLRELLAH